MTWNTNPKAPADLKPTIMADPDSDDLVTEGMRSETDLKYMVAIGISEIDVHRHHLPEDD